MFNQCFCEWDKRSLPHHVCVAILVSVYKPQNSPTEIAFCFCYHGNLDSVYVAGSCHVGYPVWRSVCPIPRWPSSLEWLLLKVTAAWSCKVGRHSCSRYLGWYRQQWLSPTPPPPTLFFASHCKPYVSINLVSKHRSKIHSVLKISNAIVQKQ